MSHPVFISIRWALYLNPRSIAISWTASDELTPRVGEHLQNRISVSWGGAERTHQGFEVLCGDYTCIEWIRVGKGQAATFPNRLPVEGGRERDGRGILAARIEHGGGVHPGSEYDDVHWYPLANTSEHGEETRFIPSWKNSGNAA